MNKQKTFFILSIIGILILLILSQTNSPPTIEGKIKSIKYGNNRIIINLENHNQEIIIFSTQLLNLQQGQESLIHGRQETYKNKTQIIADKIIQSNK